MAYTSLPNPGSYFPDADCTTLTLKGVPPQTIMAIRSSLPRSVQRLFEPIGDAVFGHLPVRDLDAPQQTMHSDRFAANLRGLADRQGFGEGVRAVAVDVDRDRGLAAFLL